MKGEVSTWCMLGSSFTKLPNELTSWPLSTNKAKTKAKVEIKGAMMILTMMNQVVVWGSARIGHVGRSFPRRT
jgi:hypothetical protein